MPHASIRYWQAMTTTEAAAVARRDPVVILPLAAVEQHGPHLPLSTDLVIGLGILANAFQRLPDDCPALALPPQAVGASREHARFPGTLSVTPALLADVVHQHGVALAGCGVRRLVLANSHGGNRATLETVGLRLRDEQGLLVVKATYTDFPRPNGVELPESEWRHGLHGGALETAMMLHLSPDDVRAGEVQERRSLGADLEDAGGRVAPEGAAAFSWLAGDLHRSGVSGDARLADAATGKILVEHYGEILADVIKDARAFPLNRLV